MSSADEKRMLEILADIANGSLYVAKFVADRLRIMGGADTHDAPTEEPAADEEQHRPHSRCDFRVYQFVRDTKGPPTKQEIVEALSECEQPIASPSTVEKSVTRLSREEHIRARPRPDYGYVAVSPPEDE